MKPLRFEVEWSGMREFLSVALFAFLGCAPSDPQVPTPYQPLDAHGGYTEEPIQNGGRAELEARNRFKKVCGEGGIRTRGGLLTRARLASGYLRPLGHLS